VKIKVSTKPCPKCRTATERDGEYSFVVFVFSFYVQFQYFLKEVVCIWFVRAVHFHGVGCVKQNGQENAWVATGSVKTENKRSLF